MRDKSKDDQKLFVGIAFFMLITGLCYAISQLFNWEFQKVLLLIYGWFTFKFSVKSQVEDDKN